MKIKVLHDVRTANYGRLFAGHIMDMPDVDAKELIRLGDVEEIAPPKTLPQTAKKTPTKKASAKKRSKKGSVAK